MGNLLRRKRLGKGGDDLDRLYADPDHLPDEPDDVFRVVRPVRVGANAVSVAPSWSAP
jgi:hypothetical protein